MVPSLSLEFGWPGYKGLTGVRHKIFPNFFFERVHVTLKRKCWKKMNVCNFYVYHQIVIQHIFVNESMVIW